eukprot:CAMPEP_0170589294 /NCGR_PEP_ID=MMETSP0224-20130122/11275_1 /TAXON_ID=285029 /ORGANISM="Togula jolla, Strain CCCM 725" /LENGTH=371 /DNA_ID=CAMNT_0010913045 /DNA_START=71 /DNA_END=1186 /DNA_ORIENTATION=+
MAVAMTNVPLSALEGGEDRLPYYEDICNPKAQSEDVKKSASLPFRNYETSQFQDRVERTYFNIQTLQTVESVKAKMDDYRLLKKAVMSVDDMMQFLDTIVDESDPDNDLPQSYHAYQTAESVLSRYFVDRNDLQNLTKVPLEMFFSSKEWGLLPAHAQQMYQGRTLASHLPHITDWSWFPLVGLIHDLGKVCMEDGFGAMPQWSGVGDTFVLGCDFDPANIFSEKNFYSQNPDSKCPDFEGKCGMYSPHCGFNKCLLSFGHDEYLALVLEGHASDVQQLREAGEPVPRKTLPAEAIYMIRFHSFYPWHTPRGELRGYTHLASDEDWRLLPLLKALQKSDLYSKTKDLPPIEELEAYYGKLIHDHFLPKLRW